jgi:predicted dehydrogenase
MTSAMLRVGIIGAGLIGEKRAAGLTAGKLVAVADHDFERAERLCGERGGQPMARWQDLVARPDLDAVIVCTTNDALSACSAAALRAGKHVLVEKPAGRNAADLEEAAAAEKASGKLLRVGFNHRFHPGLQKARALLRQGAVGPLMHIRARYGHGGRLGYEKEWRADPARAGGGSLLDQGIHLVDLCRWLAGELELAFGHAATYFWRMPVEDNGFVMLRSPDRTRAAWLQVSCTEWKNIFDFEIFGQQGKLQIIGLGRSYGQEELRFYRMKPEMGPPELETHKFPDEDLSWQHELEAFEREIAGAGGATELGTIDDALAAIRIVHGVYAQMEKDSR